MAHHRISSMDGQGIVDFDELIHKSKGCSFLSFIFIHKIHRILRSCLAALYFDLTKLIEIAVFQEIHGKISAQPNTVIIHAPLSY